MLRFDLVFALFFISLLTLAGIHILAMKFFLYWIFPWFDVLTHFLGGIVVALGYQSFLDRRVTASSVWRRLPGTLVAVLVVSISWEIFEYSAGIAIWGLDFFDTLSDLVLDLLGGIVGYAVAFRMGDLIQEHE